MKKIPTLFQRNHDTDRRVRDEVSPECEWVIKGEGVATRKWDGTCCMVKDGKLYKRLELQFYVGHCVDGRPVYVCTKDIPEEFIPCTNIDSVTMKLQGWVPVGEGNEDKWHREAWALGRCLAGVTYMGTINGPPYGTITDAFKDGTYELVGPKVNNNPEKFAGHMLVRHGINHFDVVPTFKEIMDFLKANDIEGIVWYHPDGRMAKIKRKDFGIRR